MNTLDANKLPVRLTPLRARDTFVLQNPDHHSAILRLTFSRRVRCHLLRRSHGSRRQNVCEWNLPVLFEECQNIVRAFQAELLIQSSRPDSGSIALHLNDVSVNGLCFLRQSPRSCGLYCGSTRHFSVSKVDGDLAENVVLAKLAKALVGSGDLGLVRRNLLPDWPRSPAVPRLSVAPLPQFVPRLLPPCCSVGASPAWMSCAVFKSEPLNLTVSATS